MTLLRGSDQNSKEINVALLSLEADIKNKITGFDTSAIDKQLAEINSRIDKINTSGGNNSSEEIEDINSKLNSNSNKIRNLEQNIGDIDTRIDGIEQKLSDIFSAENKVTDFNATTNSGIYYWSTDAANRPTDYGVLLVNKYDSGSGGIWVNQIAYSTYNKIYFRQNINSSNWTEWKAVAFEGELNADTVDNYHASQLWRSDGATWNPNADVVMTPSGNGNEWSFDFRNKNGATGSYWQVWDENKNTLLQVNADDGKVSAPYGFVGNLSGKADTAGTAGSANKLNSFASWNDPYDYDATNGVRIYVYKITMASWFNSILVQIYDDINYARCRKYFLGLWHANNYGYNVSVTDLGGTKDGGLHVWMGTDGNIYLQADVYWTSRIAFSRLDDITDVTITKIGEARYGSNTDINGNVLFTPLADPIVDCGALRADDRLSGASRVPQILKTDVLRASSRLTIPIGAPSSLEDGCIWIER